MKHSSEILSPTEKVNRWILSILFVLYTGITIFVLAISLVDSFKTKSDLVTNLTGWPTSFNLENYIAVFQQDNFLIYFGNSVLVTVCGTGGCILLSALTAYGISRYQFKGKSFLKSYLLIGLMVPIQVSVLPLFLILKQMSLLNTLYGLILVYISCISFPCFIFEKFFHTIPVALEESARIEGASDLKIFFRIILPLCKSVIFTIALITGVGLWNDFYMPMVLLGGKENQTLTLAIYVYLSQFMRNMNVSFAAVIITLIPVIIVYFVFSSQLVEGLTGGAVKG